ncbi:sigma-54-dependent Fis family transcriptional regulator [Polynucleobacter sp. 30F-ANTBAC]|jgi:two-component system response regulator FlrC|uniref:sigma-54-dependent transcriptional regulator n=1 Tax=Polynucleobacter sp. 30F-ANTBAC TaxID=2689095 RepID=UPI001C0D94B5|nr:sigma-54 dependent transcriptional regulator [Polynucleobacter sp. 30F-ANTBAC]MBU3599773.1 sigma-54-dependent Fis family transcriptional regulator [Polynucleobacter sp. 30F-ANTBAC]
MSKNPVLLVEDDDDLREAISITLSLKGIDYRIYERAELALAQIHPGYEGVLITDFRLPGMNGIELLKETLKICPDMPVVVMTAYADAKLAVEALKSGARDFLIKPFVPEQLVEVIARYQKQEVTGQGAKSNNVAEIIAADPATLAVMARCERVGKTDTTALLTGESGVGKDVFARRIHDLSKRAGKPYIALNCAAIPETLLESTLFGHEKGAFTGATKAQPGKFEIANGGTLFLDEIGEMPLELQAKLLRVLQDHVVERLGSRESLSCDVRIVAATNQDLQARVAEGRFREDLYFRLAVFPIKIPSLKERTQDILPLAEAFLRRYSHTMGRSGVVLSPATQQALQIYQWPGNVRELENAIQRALLLSDDDLIEPEHVELDLPINQESGTKFAYIQQPSPSLATDTHGDINSLEREHILKVLAQVGGNRKQAVAILGISERALRYKLKAYREAGFEFI